MTCHDELIDLGVGSVMSASRQRAKQTRDASAPSVKLLSPAAIPPDSRFQLDGRVRRTIAYDLGMPPPVLPAGSLGEQVRRLSPVQTAEFVLNHTRHVVDQPNVVRSWVLAVLRWLEQFPGETWEQRWLSSGADAAPRSWRAAVRGPQARRVALVTLATNMLMVGRVLRPSYGWQLDSRAGPHVPDKMLSVNDPDGLAWLRSLPAYRQALPRHRADAEACLSRVVIRTGRRLDELECEHLLHHADVVKTSGRHRREHLAWELMVALGPFAGGPSTMRAAWSAKGNTRRHSVATLVDRYGIPSGGVRDLLADYLGEIKPGMDYGSLEGLAYRLVRLFWWEVLQINPGQKDLRLAPQTVAAWRERLAVTTDGRPRREVHSTLFAVRGLYRDLAEWSHDEPIRWGQWVAPCPVQRRESRDASKVKRRQKARTQDRTRALAPLLPALVAEAVRRRDWSQRLCAAAQAAEAGASFTVDGSTFRRPQRSRRPLPDQPSELRVELVSADNAAPPIRLQCGLVNVTQAEADGFWGWAIVETLRHTGVFSGGRPHTGGLILAFAQLRG